jgi:hypothetical protein
MEKRPRERLPLKTEYYGLDRFKLKEVVNRYNDDPYRYNEYVRSTQNIRDARESSQTQ